MRYSIASDGSNVKIVVEDVGAKQAELMRELQECAMGRCSCPTPQYAKVESMQVASGADNVTVTLKAKAGEEIDQGDISKCLEHTTKKATKPG